MATERLRELVQDEVETFGPDGHPGSVLTGAVLICEWMDEDGHEWFTFTSCEARGEQLAHWRMRGLLAEADAAITVKQVAARLDADDD